MKNAFRTDPTPKACAHFPSSLLDKDSFLVAMGYGATVEISFQGLPADGFHQPPGPIGAGPVFPSGARFEQQRRHAVGGSGLFDVSLEVRVPGVVDEAGGV